MTPEEIKSLRKNLELTQGKFAEKLGVSLRSIIGWEKGQSTPHPNSVKAMQNLFSK